MYLRTLKAMFSVCYISQSSNFNSLFDVSLNIFMGFVFEPDLYKYFW